MRKYIFTGIELAVMGLVTASMLYNPPLWKNPETARPASSIHVIAQHR